MDYKAFLSYGDILARGYDLKALGRLEQGDFSTIEYAIDDFLQETFQTIYDLIESYKGINFTTSFFDDMSQEIDKYQYPKAFALQTILKWCLVEQAIFIYENGDVMTSSQIQPDKISYSPKVIRKLWNNGLLG